MPSSPRPSPTASPQAEASLPCWHGEREGTLHRIFVGISRRTPHRRRIRAFRRAAQRLTGKPFVCDPDRKWKISAKRLKDLFYDWQHDGRSALRLNYAASVRFKVSRQLLQHFFEICNQPGISTLRAAYMQLRSEGPVPVSYSALCRYLGRATLDQLQSYHRFVRESEAALVNTKQDCEAKALQAFQALKTPAA